MGLCHIDAFPSQALAWADITERPASFRDERSKKGVCETTELRIVRL